MKKAFLAITVFSMIFISCSKDDSSDPNPEPTVELKNEVNDFVWKAMNHWYFWQDKVTSLDDTKDDNIDDYYTYLNGFNEPKNLFDSFKYFADDFSWFIPDVDAQLNQFRGISVSYGIEMPRKVFQVDPDDSNSNYYIYITYVVPGSPAAEAGFKRGDLIYKINDQVLNANNYTLINDIIFPENNSSIDIGVGKLENKKIVSRLEAEINATVISENPVHHTSIIQNNGKKIGYIVYNGFKGSYNGELNDAFGTLKSEGIDELILDLRYNRGGSVLTSAFLASMIQGNKPQGEVFAKLQYNPKRDKVTGRTFGFYDEVALFNKQTGKYEGVVASNRLKNIDKLYVITSKSTASASEMIINGLRPSMDVELIGLQTTGKNEGSNTIVDAVETDDYEIYTDVANRKSNIGMQPITFQIYNSLNENDYGEGFPVNFEIDELEYSDKILPFGDKNEALLNATLNYMSGSTTKLKKSINKKVFGKKLKERNFSKEMYILPEEASFSN